MDLADTAQVSSARILELIRALEPKVLPVTVVVDHQSKDVRIVHEGEAPSQVLKDKILTRDVSGPCSVKWTDGRTAVVVG